MIRGILTVSSALFVLGCAPQHNEQVNAIENGVAHVNVQAPDIAQDPVPACGEDKDADKKKKQKEDRDGASMSASYDLAPPYGGDKNDKEKRDKDKEDTKGSATMAYCAPF